jgi:hypothetical protein
MPLATGGFDGGVWHTGTRGEEDVREERTGTTPCRSAHVPEAPVGGGAPPGGAPGEEDVEGGAPPGEVRGHTRSRWIGAPVGGGAPPGAHGHQGNPRAESTG